MGPAQADGFLVLPQACLDQSIPGLRCRGNEFLAENSIQHGSRPASQCRQGRTIESETSGHLTSVHRHSLARLLPKGLQRESTGVESTADSHNGLQKIRIVLTEMVT